MFRKGYKQSKEHTRKIVEANKKIGNKPPSRKGKKHSEESKNKMSESLKGRTSPMKNKTRSLESNNRQSLSMKGRTSPRKGVTLSNSTKLKIQKWNVEHPNKTFKNTTIEVKVEQELIKRGIYFQKQVPLCKIAIVDFYLPEFRVVIQADGCYWHNCPDHSQQSLKGRTERDSNQDSILTFNGFNVYRFWEHEINDSVEECINKIKLI